MGFNDQVSKQRARNNAICKDDDFDFISGIISDVASRTDFGAILDDASLLQRFHNAYDFIYEHQWDTCFKEDVYWEYVNGGDAMINAHDPTVKHFNKLRAQESGAPDFLTSDREVVSFYMAVKEIEPSTLLW